jgi:hypothetical protein
LSLLRLNLGEAPGEGHFFSTPFFRSAAIQLQGGASGIASVQSKIRYAPFKDAANQGGYFHTTYCDPPTPTPGKDLVPLACHPAFVFSVAVTADGWRAVRPKKRSTAKP